MFASKSEGARSSNAWLSQASVQMISRESPPLLAEPRCVRLQIGATTIRQTTAYITMSAIRSTHRRSRGSTGRSSVNVGHDVDTSEGEGRLATIAAEAHVQA